MEPKGPTQAQGAALSTPQCLALSQPEQIPVIPSVARNLRAMRHG